VSGKRLYRSREDSFLMGVCGGLGKYLEIDSNAIRLTFVVLAAWNGLGVLLYLATVLIVPEEPLPNPASPAPQPPADAQDEIRRVRMLGWLLVLAGAYLLVRGHPLFRPIMQDSLFPVILILGGVVLLFQRTRIRRG
jgi:phage shock protein C